MEYSPVRSGWVFAQIAAASAAIIILSAGCGGGGGGSSSPSPSPSPTPTPTASSSPPSGPSPSPSPSPGLTPKEQAIAVNFLPNYTWTATNSLPYAHFPDNKHIKVYIAPAVNNVADGTPSSTLSAAVIKSYVDTAISRWETATGNDFVFQYVSSATGADIQVQFVDTLSAADKADGGAGICHFFYDIFPNAVTAVLAAPAGSSTSQYPTVPAQNIQVVMGTAPGQLPSVTTHEFGHALGIFKHSTVSTDTMFAIPGPSITIRDTNTLFFLYYSDAALGKAQSVFGGSAQVRQGQL